MKLTFDELNLLVKTLSEKQNELETKKNIMQKKDLNCNKKLHTF